MRSLFANLRSLVLPFGAFQGTRIVLDGTTGTIQLYDENDNLVGLISPDVWYTGVLGGAQVQLDPFGGIRIRDINGNLVALLNAQGLQMSDPLTGLVGATLGAGGLTIASDAGGSVVIGGGPTLNTPVPVYAGSSAAAPGANIPTPSATAITADDIEIRHACAWDVGALGGQTMTPPAGYTEEFDDTASSATFGTMNVSVATRQPAVSNAVRNFVDTSALWDSYVGHTIVLRGTSGTPPSVLSVSDAFSFGNTKNHFLTLASPAGATTGHILVAFVSLGNIGGSVPESWTVPEGWIFLGAKFTIGTLSTVATGVWYKLATASEPVDYDVTVNFPTTTNKRFHSSVICIQDADVGGAIDLGLAFDGDAFLYRDGPGKLEIDDTLNVIADLQVNDMTIGRGQVGPAFGSAGNSAAYASDADTDMARTIDLVSGREYEISLHIPLVVRGNGSARWQINVDAISPSAVRTQVARLFDTAGITAGITTFALPHAAVPFVANATGTWTFWVWVHRVDLTSTLQFQAAAGVPRFLWVKDIGDNV